MSEIKISQAIEPLQVKNNPPKEVTSAETSETPEKSNSALYVGGALVAAGLVAAYYAFRGKPNQASEGVKNVAEEGKNLVKSFTEGAADTHVFSEDNSKLLNTLHSVSDDIAEKQVSYANVQNAKIVNTLSSASDNTTEKYISYQNMDNLKLPKTEGAVDTHVFADVTAKLKVGADMYEKAVTDLYTLGQLEKADIPGFLESISKNYQGYDIKGFLKGLAETNQFDRALRQKNLTNEKELPKLKALAQQALEFMQ